MFKLIRKYIVFCFIYNKGVIKENLGEYPDSLDYFYLALSLNPNSVKTYIAIARISKKIKSYLNGIDFLNKASWRFPYNAQIHSVKADLFRCAKDYDNAILSYDSAIKNDGGNFNYYLERAKIKELLGDIQGALNDYNGAVKIKSNNAQLYSQRAFYYFERKNYLNASENWKKAIELNPKKGHYYYMLACMQTFLEQNEIAKVNFDKAKQLQKSCTAFKHQL